MRAAIKVNNIREDLGSVGSVIARQIEDAMLGKSSTFDVSATNSTPTSSTQFITTFAERVNPQESTNVITEVFNTAGMRVWHQSTQVDAGGQYATFTWQLTDYAGNHLPSGVYFYRSKVANKYTSTKKLIIK